MPPGVRIDRKLDVFGMSHFGQLAAQPRAWKSGRSGSPIRGTGQYRPRFAPLPALGVLSERRTVPRFGGVSVPVRSPSDGRRGQIADQGRRQDSLHLCGRLSPHYNEAMKRSGHADLPLHGGNVPQWLAQRMAALGGAISESIILHYGTDELLARLADPFWFQAFGCVLGMDWHSSGITTSVVGALSGHCARKPLSWESMSAAAADGIHGRRLTNSYLSESEPAWTRTS